MPIARRYDTFTLHIGSVDIDADIDVDYVSGSAGDGETLVLDLTYLTGRPLAKSFDIDFETQPAAIFSQPPPKPTATYEPNEPDDTNVNERQSGTLTVAFPSHNALLGAIRQSVISMNTPGHITIKHVATATIKQNTSPEFVEGVLLPGGLGIDKTARRSILENLAAGTDVGVPVIAYDPDVDDTLTYSLEGSGKFRINPSTGQIQTTTILDYETSPDPDREDNHYSLTAGVTDGEGGDDFITVLIEVRDSHVLTHAPTFDEGRTTNRYVPEDAAPNTNIGKPVSATDADTADADLTYTLQGIHAGFFEIDRTNGQLKTSAALDYESQNTFYVTVRVEDDADNTDEILVTINVTDVPD